MNAHSYFPGGPILPRPTALRIKLERTTNGFRITREHGMPYDITPERWPIEQVRLINEAENRGGGLEIQDYTNREPVGVILKEKADV